MESAVAQYKLIKRIKDEKFEEEDIHNYVLLISIGSRDFQTAVVDTRDNRLLQQEDYMLPEVSSADELLSTLDQLFEAHAYLRAGFWKEIKVSLKNQKFAQVPKALFSPEAIGEYLKFNAHIDASNETFLHTSLESSEIVTVFPIQNHLREWLERVYPGKDTIFTHQSAVLIEGVVQYAISHDSSPLFVYIDRFRLHILAVKGGKLLYYNQFLIKQFADYIKYIMLVLKSLGMNQKTSVVQLWGYIGKNSPHYHEFYKYINNVTFGGRPSFLTFGYIFDEVQEHHFFDLYNIHMFR